MGKGSSENSNGSFQMTSYFYNNGNRFLSVRSRSDRLPNMIWLLFFLILLPQTDYIFHFRLNMALRGSP